MTTKLQYALSHKIIYSLHSYIGGANGTANNAATIHAPQIAATVTRHFGCEETWPWEGFLLLCIAGC
jgi:hypothetical protein